MCSYGSTGVTTDGLQELKVKKKTFRDDDAVLSLVADRFVAVLGFGAVGAAHAECLRDSGVSVVVGLAAEDGAEREAAAVKGFATTSIAQACEDSNMIVMTQPDHIQPQTYVEHIRGNIAAGDALVFNSGFNVAFGFIDPEPGVDVLLVAPLADAGTVRAEFENGRGVPAVMATTATSSATAVDLVLSYSRAIGGLRECGLMTTFEEYTQATLFASHLVGDGLVPEVVRVAFDTLVQSGCTPHIAYLATVQYAQVAVQRAAQLGVAGAREGFSDLACYAGAQGVRVGRMARTLMEGMFEAVAGGEFGSTYFLDQANGGLQAKGFRSADTCTAMDAAGDAVEELFGRRQVTRHVDGAQN